MYKTSFNKNDWYSLKLITSDSEGLEALSLVTGQLYKRNTQYLIEVMDLIESYINKFPNQNPSFSIFWGKDLQPNSTYFMAPRDLSQTFFKGSVDERKLVGLASFLNSLKHKCLELDSVDSFEKYYFAIQAVSPRIMDFIQRITNKIPRSATLIDVTSNALVFSDKINTYRYIYPLTVEKESFIPSDIDYRSLLRTSNTPLIESVQDFVIKEQAIEGYICTHALLISDEGHQQAIIKGIVDIIGSMHQNNILGNFSNLHNYFYDPAHQKVYLMDTCDVYKYLTLSKGLIRASIINRYSMFSGTVGEIGGKFEVAFTQTPYWNSLPNNIDDTQGYEYLTPQEFKVKSKKMAIEYVGDVLGRGSLTIPAYKSPEQQAYEERKKKKKGLLGWFR